MKKGHNSYFYISLIALFILSISIYFFLPGYLILWRTIFIISIFAISYDLLQGHAGIVSLGHAIFFGIGAYTVGIVGSHGITDPIVTLILGMAISGTIAGSMAPVVVKGNDFNRLLVTLGFCFLFHEAANHMQSLTGGADGLSSFTVSPLFGRFEFDFEGKIAFAYSFICLIIAYTSIRVIVNSQFGLILKGIRENTDRLYAVGSPVNKHQAMAYVFSGMFAGMAGAILAQTSNFVSLDMLGFERSADVVVMTALGGTGSIPGVIFGAGFLTWFKDLLSSFSPKYWQLGIGLILMTSVFLFPNGIAGFFKKFQKRD